ncbi:MAG: leucine-rich repeat domain-containing protein, partial [Muribaculaceae bacterium]|nr:leucine-rich repeat domain-containing protein [Muribaculaceae bacterium]
MKMRKSYFSMLAAVTTLAAATPAEARNVLLPMGLYSQAPWEAKYLFIGENFYNDTEAFKLAPGENWFATDFDDSTWKKNYGPVSTESGSLSYYNTTWEKEFGAAYFRRHFTVENPESLKEVILYTVHDDDLVVYLNGTKIYENSYVVGQNSSYMANVLSDENRALLKKGDNVIAVAVCDHGGADAYADFGLYGSNLANGSMEQYGEWSGSYNTSSYNGNNFGYKWGRNPLCQQTLEGMPAGIYRFSANACGMLYYYDKNTAYEHRNDPMPFNLFVGTAETPIPSAFSERLSGGDYVWEIESGQYVPYEPGKAADAMNRDAYACDVWVYYDPAVDGNQLTFGIKGGVDSPTDECWSVWDNLDLQYYSEKDVEAIVNNALSRVEEIKKLHFDRGLYKELMASIESIKVSTDLASKSSILAELLRMEGPVRRSLAEYSCLFGTLSELKTTLDKVALTASPLTVGKARTRYNDVSKAYEDSSYSSAEINTVVAELNTLVRQLGYTYIDITVNVPGSMGDSILKRVENFVDVQSLKISGTLDSEDINTLQSRLTTLREIDMTDLNMTALPKNFFYQRTGLEKILLPSKTTSIGERAMYGCSSLKEIVMPADLKSIGEYAFCDCRSLNAIDLPEGFTSLGNYCFYTCPSLESVKIPSSLAVIPTGAFYQATKLSS